MTAKLPDNQIYLRKCIKVVEALLKEYPQIFPLSGAEPPLAERVQREALRSNMETLIWRSKLLLRYYETSDVVYMIADENGELRQATREQVMKILSKQDDIKEVMPNE